MMAEVAEVLTPWVARFGVADALPAAISGRRADALRRFAAAGLPTRRLEAWKYTDLRALGEIAFRGATAVAFTGEVPHLAAGPCHRLVFVSGHFRPELSAVAPPPGVEVHGLAATIGDEDLSAVAGDGMAASPMVLLNTGLATAGLHLRVAAGVALDRPIELVFIGGLDAEPTAWHPRHRIELADGSAATVIEIHTGAGGGTYLANHVAEIVVGANARLRHIVSQQEGESAYHIASRFATVAADGRLESFALTSGGRVTRNETSVSLAGPGASCGLAGAYLLRGRGHCDTTTVVDHGAPHTACREVFKGVLADSARGVFQGRIVVQRGAQKADGYQLSKALLLSDDAEVDQKPELEIYADDVKCSHGAAAGQLDANELFYLRSRGISEAAARRLLIEGFLTDVFDEVSDEDLRQALLTRARQWFAAEGGQAP